MLRFFVVWIGLVLWLAGGGTARAQQAPPDTTRPGARLAFPNHGVVNLFVIFVQHADEPDGAGRFGDDPLTEWPADWSRGADHRLPSWAEGNRLLASPGTPPDVFDDGSLSAFYDLMSHGRFHVTGYVYPKVVVPEHSVDWYHANRGAFPNGAVRLAHEILTSDALQTYLDENPDGLDLEALDTYRNGTNTYGPDGVFDVIVLIHRDLTLPRLRRSYNGSPIGGSSITSFGADAVFRPDHPEDFSDPMQDAFAPAPVTLGGLRVIDNLTSGSGITINALTRKQTVRGLAHEIGHRHFGLYHTCESELSPDSDCVGLMTGASLTMSAGDRIKLGWAEVVPIDVPRLGRLDATFPDALHSGQVFRLRDGANQCGDVIVEARFWSNFWDSPPNPDRPEAPFFGNDDGDDADLFLPQEGLYLYKAPAVGQPRCGGNRTLQYDEHRFSSLENNGLGRRLSPFREGLSEELRAYRVGGAYQVAYMPGDAYAAYTQPRFFYHRHPTLDARLSLMDITRRDDAFTATIWTDYLAEPSDLGRPHITAYPNPFTNYTTIRYEVAEESSVVLDVYDVLGRRIVRLAEGRHQPGVHEKLFFPGDLPGGRYWCRIRTGGQSRVVPLNRVR